MPLGKGYTLTYDGVASTTLPQLIVEKVTRKMTGKNRDIYREVAGREGAWRFGEKKGLRSIVAECAVVSTGFPTTRRADLVAIADWLDKGGFKKLIISDEPDRFYRAILANEPEIDEWREWGKFSLEFTAEPYAYDNTINLRTFSHTVGTPTDNWTSTGKVITYPVVDITAVGGSLTSVTVSFNGDIITYGSTILSGQSISINSIGYVVVTGVNGDTDLVGDFSTFAAAMSDVSGTFHHINPGVNNFITVTAGVGSTATSMTSNVRWRERYR